MSASLRPQIELTQRVARFFYLTAAFVVVAGGLAVWSFAASGLYRVFLAGLAVVLALAGAFAVSAWCVRGGRLRVGIGLALGAMILAALGMAAGSGRGLQALLLGGLGTIVMVAAVIFGRRASSLIASACAIALLAMFVGQSIGLFTTPTASLTPQNLLVTQLLLLGVGLLFGWMVGEIVDTAARDAAYREQRFRALLGIASDWYWEQDAQFRFTTLRAWKSIPGGIDEAATLGKKRWELTQLDVDADQWAAHRALLLEHRPFRDFIVRTQPANGRVDYLSISGEPIVAANGEFAGYWGVGRAVTAEVEAQRALEASERRYRALFDRTPSPLIIHRQGVIMAANRAAAGLLGYAEAQAMVGRGLLEHYSPECLDVARRRVAALETLPVGSELPLVDLLVVRRDGEMRDVEATGVRVQLADGPATLSIYFDITERKRAEAALRRSEQMLSHLFEASPDAIVVSEIETSRVLMINGRFEAMFGFSRDEVIGRRSLDLDLWADPADRERLVAALRRDGVARDVPVRRRAKDGRVLSVRYSAALMQLEGRDYFIGTMRDVTAREQARLQQDAILQNASIGIAFTRDRRFELANPRFEEMFGWVPGTLVGQPGSVVWRSAADYDDVGRAIGPLLAQGQPVELERPMRRRDGSEFWCRVRGRVVDPTQPASGGAIWIAEDVTEKRAFDNALAHAREQAEAANRAKSTFLANMSHEIRTPLNGVLGLARLARQTIGDVPRLREYLQRLVESADTLAAIISDILDLSKIEAGKLEIETIAFELRPLIESACAAYREVAAGKGLAFELKVGDEVAQYLTGDPLRLRQIVGNYVANAIKFTERGGIAVSVEGCGGDRVRIAVRDSGIGVDAAARERLFAPFTQGDESTTRRFGGTGLGLSICRQLAQLMRGEVGFDSTPGVGSTFWVELPLPAAAVSTPAAAEPAEGDRPLAGMRVLLVEDNPVNMLIAEQLLVHWGAEVTQAEDGQQAIAAVERAAGGFDVVLMDVHMPVMGGHEATAELRRRYSRDELPIVALTAAALVSEQQESLAVGMNDFIAKPIEARRMIEVLRRVAAGRSAQTAGSGTPITGC